MQLVNENKNITFDDDELSPVHIYITSQRLKASNILDKFTQRHSGRRAAEMQADVGNKYEKLQFDFKNFRNVMKKNLPTTKTVFQRQATLTIFKII